MDFQPSDEQRMLVDSLRAFVTRELRPHEELVEKNDSVPEELGREIVRKALELGFFAANMPEEVGGGGLSYTSLALMEMEFGKTSFALQTFVGRPSEILLACQGDQVERYLKPCVRGEKHELFALTEPGAGSDILSMTTRARQDGGDYVIDGAKHFISSQCPPDFAIVFAVTGLEQTERGERKRVTAFLVDREAPGFDLRRGPRCTSHRGYHTYQLSFDGCRVPAGQILGAEGEGLELANKWLHMGRVWVGAGCCGRAARLLDLATEWAATRKQFGQAIGKFQGTGFKLADMATELRAAELLVMNAAWKAEQGTMTTEDAAMAKLFASEMVGRAADHTVQIYGGMGLMEELPVERLWRDSRLERIWDGTSEIQRHIIARSLLRPLGA
ncbi:MAG: acyl-CoA dehydrogenase family protein [Pseudomonadota bacterium]